MPKSLNSGNFTLAKAVIRWSVIILALILAAVSGTYTVRHFAIDTHVNNLISRDLPWRKRELEYQAAFPQSRQLILVVVEAPTPEQTSGATRTHAEGLSKRTDLFRSVQEEGGGAFFQQNRLLFVPTEQVANSPQLNRSSARLYVPATPILRDVTEQAVLEPVPFRRAGRILAHHKGQARRVGKFLQLDLPQPDAAAIGTAAIGRDHQTIGQGSARVPSSHASGGWR